MEACSPSHKAPMRHVAPRAAHTARLSRSLRPPSPRQASRQSRGLLALLDARTRHLRSKRRGGHRKRLDNRKHFCGEFSHARRLLRHSNGSFRILRHESALHSTSLASEFQFGKTPNNGAAENCSARHGSCCSRSLPSRAIVAFSYVRCRHLRSTLAATAPRSAVSELESLAVASELRPEDPPKTFR